MIFRTGKRVLSLITLCLILSGISVSAQTFVRYVLPSDIGTKALYADSILTSVMLPWGSARIEGNQQVQEAAFELADVLRNKNLNLLSVYVCGSTSPDGLWQDNVDLSKARTEAAVRYLRQVTGVPSNKIHSKSLDEDWNRLHELVSASDIPFKDEVLDIIVTKTWSERKKALHNLDGGKVWRILVEDFFPKMRCVRIAIFCQWNPTEPYLESETVAGHESDTLLGTESVTETEPKPEPEPEPEQVPVISPVPAARPKADTIYIRDTIYYIKETVYIPYGSTSSYIGHDVREIVRTGYPKKEKRVRPVYDTPWLMGVKTNLVADAIVVPTVGMEVQIGEKTSFDLQGFYTGFNVFNTADRNTNVYGFSPEVRFWPGGMTMRKGQFIGIHARCAWYTLQWTDGLLYQNGPEDMWEGNYHNAGNLTPSWSAGMTYGYALGFGSKNQWGLEFLVGIGYANYKQNIAAYNNGIWALVEHQNKHHFGITRVGVNLTYRFSLRKVNPDYYNDN